MSYKSYEIDDHVTPINFQPDLRYSASIFNDQNNAKILNNYTKENKYKSKSARNVSTKSSTPIVEPSSAYSNSINSYYYYYYSMHHILAQ